MLKEVKVLYQEIGKRWHKSRESITCSFFRTVEPKHLCHAIWTELIRQVRTHDFYKLQGNLILVPGLGQGRAVGADISNRLKGKDE